jgi:alpha-tubulin suppressor-like RCC1 family protein
MAGVRVRSVAAGDIHSLALSWDGRVYSWGGNLSGQLGHGDTLARLVPTLLEGLENMLSISAAGAHSLAVTQSGSVFSWGLVFSRGGRTTLRPSIVHGFREGVRVRRVFCRRGAAFAIGDAGECFSWGSGNHNILCHGDTQEQISPKLIKALWSVTVSSVSIGYWHALALAEDGLVYAWGTNTHGATLGIPKFKRVRLPAPIEALRGVRMVGVAAAGNRSYAVADTGELWAWGVNGLTLLGHDEQGHFLSPSRLSRCGASR